MLENHDTLFSMIATRKNLVGIQLVDIDALSVSVEVLLCTEGSVASRLVC